MPGVCWPLDWFPGIVDEADGRAYNGREEEPVYKGYGVQGPAHCSVVC
jgi:hypothetical protein